LRPITLRKRHFVGNIKVEASVDRILESERGRNEESNTECIISNSCFERGACRPRGTKTRRSEIRQRRHHERARAQRWNRSSIRISARRENHAEHKESAARPAPDAHPSVRKVRGACLQ